MKKSVAFLIAFIVTIFLFLKSGESHSSDTYDVKKFDKFCVSFEETTCVTHPGIYYVIVEDESGANILKVFFIVEDDEPKKHRM